MTKVVFETGLGILPGERVEVEQEYLDRLREKREADEVDLFRLIELGAQQEAQEASKQNTELQRVYDAIDSTFGPHLKNELEAVNKTARVSAADKKRFARFQAFCLQWGLQALPAAPQAVALHLAGEDAAHMSHIAHSISRIHRAVQMSDPCSDVLVRAMLLLAHNEVKANNPKKGDN
jgi:hypothetical protein